MERKVHLIQQAKALVTLHGEPNGEDHESANQGGFHAFSQNTTFEAGKLRVFTGEGPHVLDKVAGGRSMIDAAQTGIGSLAPFPMSPLENFMKHERPTFSYILTTSSMKASQLIDLLEEFNRGRGRNWRNRL